MHDYYFFHLIFPCATPACANIFFTSPPPPPNKFSNSPSLTQHWKRYSFSTCAGLVSLGYLCSPHLWSWCFVMITASFSNDLNSYDSALGEKDKRRKKKIDTQSVRGVTWIRVFSEFSFSLEWIKLIHGILIECKWKIKRPRVPRKSKIRKSVRVGVHPWFRGDGGLISKSKIQKIVTLKLTAHASFWLQDSPLP